MTVEGDVSLNIIIREACESDLSILIEYNRALAKETERCAGNEIQVREDGRCWKKLRSESPMLTVRKHKLF